jgi:pyrroloquinoline quinone (PQQ) biosynthesis protein C
MLAAHVLDNRAGGICGLKFQAYVTLGAESYDEHIKEFLKSIKGSKTNRVREEIDIYQLLTYCGTDTLLEYLLAVIQMEKMGFDRTTLTVQ